MITNLKRTTANSILSETESKREVWTNVIEPTRNELRDLCETHFLPYEELQHILDKDEKAQLEVGENYVLILFQVPHGMKTWPFSIIITAQSLITVSLGQYSFLEELIKEPPSHFFTSKRTRATLSFYQAALQAFMQGLIQAEKKMEQLEQAIQRQKQAHKSLHTMLQLQKQLIYYNTAVVANEGILNKMLQQNTIKQYKSDEEVLNDLLMENSQAKEMIKIYTQILSTISDTYSSMISNNVNHTMKVLTSFTIIMTVPTISASLYGMNVILPYQNHPAAFLGVVLGTTLLAIVITVIFRLKRWL